MIVTVSIIFFLIFQNFTVADDNSNSDNEISWGYTIGVIIGSVLITIIFTSFVYLILKCMKKNPSQPEYYVEDVSIQKDGNEYYSENKDAVSPVAYLNQIQPILTVSEVVSSVKHALEDLGNAVIPHRWSTAKQMVTEESSVQEKTDLSI